MREVNSRLMTPEQLAAQATPSQTLENKTVQNVVVISFKIKMIGRISCSARYCFPWFFSM